MNTLALSLVFTLLRSVSLFLPSLHMDALSIPLQASLGISFVLDKIVLSS